MNVVCKKTLLSVLTTCLILSSSLVSAVEFSAAVENKDPCPVNAAYPDRIPAGTATTEAIDAEFGAGAQAITQCLKERKSAKIVVRVDNLFRADAFGASRFNAPTFLSNIDKMINQYENTHGMTIGEDIDIRVVFSSSGAILASTRHPAFAGAAKKWNAAHADGPFMTVSPVNPYMAAIQKGIAHGMKFYLCQEASRALGITMANKVEGVYFVPAAHAATADFQMDGYAIVLP